MKRYITNIARQFAGSSPFLLSRGEPHDSYDVWARGAIRGVPFSPSHLLTATWSPDSPYWPIVVRALDEAELLFAEGLLREIKTSEVQGAIVEFGVFEGRWLESLANLHDHLDLGREIFGFDSFEGLPVVSAANDLNCWHEGQYKADFDSVYARLRCAERGHIHLIRGWFSDSLTRLEIQEIEAVAYARIDCDLYQPAVEVLEFLSPRLSDGAILVFDDWTWNLQKGETKAFAEWCAGTGLMFEFLASTMGHVYLKVKKG